MSLLLTIPDGDTWPERAVASVHRRGFLGGYPHLCEDCLLMAQVLRLAEEVGEVEAAKRASGHGPAWVEELADVAIVCAQVAWLTGMDLPSLAAPQTQLAGTTLPIELAKLMRSLRKAAPGSYGEIHAGLQRMVWVAKTLAAQCGAQLAPIITAKLEADEQRGQLHGSAPAGWVNMTASG